MESVRLNQDFFKRDVLEIAPDLIGKILVRKLDDGSEIRARIFETESYQPQDDLNCGTLKGVSQERYFFSDVGGHAYICTAYGALLMLTITTSVKGDPNTVLIRSVEGGFGPGEVTKLLHLDKSFNGENLAFSNHIWVEDDGAEAIYQTEQRTDLTGSEERWHYFLNNLESIKMMAIENQESTCPCFWNFLSMEDQSAYIELKQSLANIVQIKKSKKGLIEFPLWVSNRQEYYKEQFQKIYMYAVRGDENDWIRFLVCGIC